MKSLNSKNMYGEAIEGKYTLTLDNGATFVAREIENYPAFTTSEGGTYLGYFAKATRGGHAHLFAVDMYLREELVASTHPIGDIVPLDWEWCWAFDKDRGKELFSPTPPPSKAKTPDFYYALIKKI